MCRQLWFIFFGILALLDALVTLQQVNHLVQCDVIICVHNASSACCGLEDVYDVDHAAFALVPWRGSSDCWQPHRAAISSSLMCQTQMRPPSPAVSSWQIRLAAFEQGPDIKLTL